jgi:hypothetical protein
VDTIDTAVASPITLPTPNITATSIPGEAALRVTKNDVCALEAPSANDDCSIFLSTELIAVVVINVIVGSTIIVNVNTIVIVVPPATPNAPFTASSIHLAPKAPYITEGMAASIAIEKYNGDLSHLGAILEMNNAVSTAIGVAIRIAKKVVHIVFTNMNPAAKYVTPS